MTLSDAAATQLASWFAKRPVISLMGEFSAGKSTLLNLLLDGDVLPTKVTATNLPSVWVYFSEEFCAEGLRHDGTLEPVDMDKLGEDVRETYLLLRMGVPSEILRFTDLIDTPGISDPKLAKGATLFLGDYVDAVLWLSPANQAWRQTEKTVWQEFPDSLYDKSLLVLTRSDKLRRVSDLTKVSKRVRSETSGLFRDVLPINTPRAAGSKEKRTGKDWQASGGKDLYAALDILLDEAASAQKLRDVPADPEPAPAPEATVSEPESEIASAPEVTAAQETLPAEKMTTEPEIKPTPAAPEPAPEEKPKGEDKRKRSAPKTTVETLLAAEKEFAPDWLAEELANCDNNVQNFDQVVSLFEHLRDKLDGDTRINPTKRFVLKQCLSAGEDSEANVERLLEQARSEVADFEKDSWCVIEAS